MMAWVVAGVLGLTRGVLLREIPHPAENAGLRDDAFVEIERSPSTRHQTITRLPPVPHCEKLEAHELARRALPLSYGY
jgi:hypothetical protein